ncbi:MAG: histidinol-phosphate transaminase [Blautia sp.]|nr:histidinol-phosphate transaminase [Blautia sp.]
MKNWEANIRKVVPYIPGEQPTQTNVIKLNTNENPYPPSPKAAAVIKTTDTDSLRLYPDPAAGKLVHAIAKAYHLKDDQVFVGVGSDDVLAMCFLTFFNGKSPILFPDITYSFYDVWADLFRIPYETVPLDDNFKMKPEDYFRPNGGIVLANPNAPTGIELEQGSIRRILEKNRDCIVIVDEAYVDFGGESCLPMLEDFDNLIVVQTFSKSRNLAGMRIGYAMASPSLIRYLNDVKYSFNSYTMNRLVIEAGAAAVEDDEYFRACCDRIIRTREWAKEELRARGFHFADSRTNFIFASHELVSASELFEALRRAGIFVRHFPKERISNYLRITVGTPEQMKALFDFLDDYLPGASTRM